VDVVRPFQTLLDVARPPAARRSRISAYPTCSISSSATTLFMSGAAEVARSYSVSGEGRLGGQLTTTSALARFSLSEAHTSSIR
jgi:hypothetical protein